MVHSSTSSGQSGLLAERLKQARVRLSGGSTIPKRIPGDGAYPLSVEQEQVWFIDQMADNASFLNLSHGFEIVGDLNVEAFIAAVSALVLRHENLRTIVTPTPQGPIAEVVAEAKPGVRFVELGLISGTLRQTSIDALLREGITRRFQLQTEPPVRFRLIRISDRRHIFQTTIHHIASDRATDDILPRDLGVLYRQHLGISTSVLQPLRVQYGDFAAWQRSCETSGTWESSLRYWKARLHGLRPLEVSPDKPRPIHKSYRGERNAIEINPGDWTALCDLSRDNGWTRATVLLAVYFLLLYRYTGRRNIAVGCHVSNRHQAELQGLIGYFLNTLILRTDIDPTMPMRSLIEATKNVLLDAFAHSDVPFGVVLQHLRQKREPGTFANLQVLFGHQDVSPIPRTTDLGFDVKPLRPFQHSLWMDLYLNILDRGSSGTALLDFDPDLYDATTGQLFLRCYCRLLSSVVHAPESPLSELPWYDSADAPPTELLAPRYVRRPDDRALIQERFEHVATSRPSAIAIREVTGRTLTYEQLNVAANKLATYLAQNGVQDGDRVGICLDRSADLIVTIMAVLKAGATYVPLDPLHPAARLQMIAGQSRVSLVLTTRDLQSRLSHSRMLLLDEQANLIDASSGSLRNNHLPCESAAYVIFTSGSTGTPKGVEVTHRNVTWLIDCASSVLDVSVDNVWTFSHTYAFDYSVWEIFGCICTGGTLVVVPSDLAKDPSQLDSILRRENISVLSLTPSAFRSLVGFQEDANSDRLPSLRYVIFGGESIDMEVVRRWWRRHQPQRPILTNMYGITETTVHVTHQALSPTINGLSPIGLPLPGAQVHILDPEQQPVPYGVCGEIYVGGLGLANGYLRQPHLTAERFVPNPFGELGTRLYRSGDFGRVLRDGTLEYVGRSDSQIKLRGFRIELAEIEKEVRAVTSANDVAIKLVDDAVRGGCIVAYVCRQTVDERATKDALRDLLPEYMIPQRIISLDTFPLTINGKLDYDALPPPPLAIHRKDTVFRSESPIRDILREIWSETLKEPSIADGADFFELGGHSLLAAQVTSRIRQIFRINLPVRSIFENSSLNRLAQCVAQELTLSGHIVDPEVPIARTNLTVFPLSTMQRRLWFLNQFDPNDASYNMPALVRVRGTLHLPLLVHSFESVLRRHSALRTTFKTKEGEPYQCVHATASVEWQHATVPRLICDEDAMKRLLRSAIECPFHLDQTPPLRIVTLRMETSEWYVLLVIHHIIADAWSGAIIMTDLLSEYERLSSDALEDTATQAPLQYLDAAQWFAVFAVNAKPNDKENAAKFWRSLLGDAPFSIDLGAPYLGTPELPSVIVQRSSLEHSSTEAIDRYCRANGVTPFMYLLAVWQVVLHHASGQESFIIGVPFANRDHPDLESVVGFLANMLPFPLRTRGATTFSTLLQQIRDTTFDVYAHQSTSLEEIVSALELHSGERDPRLFHAVFSYQNTPTPSPGPHDLCIEWRSIDPCKSKFDIVMSITRNSMEYEITLEHDPERVSDYLSRSLLSTFKSLADHLLRHDQTLTTSAPLNLDGYRACPEDTDKLRCATDDFLTSFAKWVRREPMRQALRSSEFEISYEQLDEFSSRLARLLLDEGLSREQRVGVHLPSGTEHVGCAIAILKAGGTYVPLDPLYPKQRLDFMINDAALAVIISNGPIDVSGLETAPRVMHLDGPFALVDSARDAISCPLPLPLQAAYVIYTSGSTGVPKGVEISWEGFTNLLGAIQSIFELNETDVTVQLASSNFDASVSEWAGALSTGGTVVFPPDDASRAGEQLSRLINLNGVTIATLTPSVLRTLPLNPPLPLKTLVVVGEPLDPALYASWHSRVPNLLNGYGPTEATIGTTYWKLHDELRRIQRPTAPLGTPIPNVQVYVLGPDLQMLDCDWMGEICIAGPGLARGYLGRPDITAERFVPNPYGEPGSRIYRTGDIGRRLISGDLQFLGRVDNQLKVRGFRIEPAEVEANINRIPGVHTSIVAPRRDGNGGTFLAAYVIATCSIESIRTELQSRLPVHMLPSAITLVDAIPLTRNGKADYELLAKTGVPQIHHRIHPKNSLETLLKTFWTQLLNVSEIGTNESFFELGGHSLLATRILSKVNATFSVEVPLKELFSNPTVEALARLIEARESFPGRSRKIADAYLRVVTPPSSQ